MCVSMKHPRICPSSPWLHGDMLELFKHLQTNQWLFLFMGEMAMFAWIWLPWEWVPPLLIHQSETIDHQPHRTCHHDNDPFFSFFLFWCSYHHGVSVRYLISSHFVLPRQHTALCTCQCIPAYYCSPTTGALGSCDELRPCVTVREGTHTCPVLIHSPLF